MTQGDLHRLNRDGSAVTMVAGEVRRAFSRTSMPCMYTWIVSQLETGEGVVVGVLLTSRNLPWLSRATARLFTACHTFFELSSPFPCCACLQKHVLQRTTKFSGSAARTFWSSVIARCQSPSADAKSAAFMVFWTGSAVGSSATAARCFAAIAMYPPCR